MENEELISKTEENVSPSEETLSEDTADETSEEHASQEPPSEEPKNKKDLFAKLRTVYDYIETFCVALSVMIIMFLFFFRYVSVDGDSMLPTLHGLDSSNHADRLIISDFLYEPQTGDIVVVNTDQDSQPLIKRVIAVGGQTVRIDFENWEVEVDGVLLDETYIKKIAGATMHSADMNRMYGIDENGVCEFTVGEGKVFVMGDNRNNSKDSRYASVGEQDVSHILGKVVLRLFPMDEFGSVE